MNNLQNTEFYAGDVEEVLPEILKDIENKPETVFVDPPRKNLDNKTIDVLKNLRTKNNCICKL